MPYANNNGVKIYYEVEGQGPPLVLAHGAGGDLTAWQRNGYKDALKNDHQLILFDARGHGKSDKPHEVSDHGLRLYADDVVAVIDDLRITKAHYFGYSMGARTGFQCAIQSPSRFYSFILGGMMPYRRAAESFQNAVSAWKTLRDDPQAALQRREQQLGRTMTDGEKESFLALDAEALVASLSATANWSLTNEELSRITVPCLLYCGGADEWHTGAKEGASHTPRARFVSLPGLSHAQGGQRSDLVLPHVKEFLAQVSKTQSK